MDINTLREIGEWAAVGFYEGIDLPWPRSYGLAMRRMYENMPVRVPDKQLLIPCESLFEGRNNETHGVHHVVSYICNFFHHSGLEIQPCIADQKKEQFPQHAEFIDALVKDLQPRLPHFGGYTHTNPDIRRVVNEGFDAMEAELDAELATLQSVARDLRDRDQELNLLLSLKDYTAGVKALYDTTLAALRDAVDAASGERK